MDPSSTKTVMGQVREEEEEEHWHVEAKREVHQCERDRRTGDGKGRSEDSRVGSMPGRPQQGSRGDRRGRWANEKGQLAEGERRT